MSRSTSRSTRRGKQIHWMEAVQVIRNVQGVMGEAVQLIVAGSYRRAKMEVNDLDFVTVLRGPLTDKDFFTLCRIHFGNPILGGKEGDRKAQYLWNGVLLDFYLTEKDKIEPMLLFLTGSATTNIKMRSVAKAKGFALNQYSLTNRETGELIGKQTEQGIFETLGLDYLHPKER